MFETIIFAYLLAASALFAVFVRARLQAGEKQLKKAQEHYQAFVQKKREIDEEKNKLTEEAFEVFTLYELTKTLSKNFDEKEAVAVFKTTLNENVQYEDCRILSAAPEELLSLESGYSVIELKVHNDLLGYLAIKGCHENDRDKAAILAHQFALALRRNRLYKDVEQLAVTDSLTEVHTRRYFLARLEEEINRSLSHGSPLSFLMIDVDYFKHLNDQYGHLTGDQVLCGVADLIKENIREIDIVGRYGGEEFSVALPETDVAGANQVAERIRVAIAKNLISAADAKVHVTVSVGLAIFPKDAKDVNDLIDKADWALYRAKKNGRNLVYSFGS